jgi:hypothetical protein
MISKKEDSESLNLTKSQEEKREIVEKRKENKIKILKLT